METLKSPGHRSLSLSLLTYKKKKTVHSLLLWRRRDERFPPVVLPGLNSIILSYKVLMSDPWQWGGGGFLPYLVVTLACSVQLDIPVTGVPTIGRAHNPPVTQ